MLNTWLCLRSSSVDPCMRVSTCEQVSGDESEESFSDINGAESPPHRAAKERYFQRLLSKPQAVSDPSTKPDEVLTRQSASWTSGVASWDVQQPRACSEGEPASSSSAVSESVRQPLLPKPRAKTFELKYMKCPAFGYEEIPRIYDGFTRTAEHWPDPQPESSSWKPFFFPRQKHFKYGGCPECPSRALTPVVVTDVPKWQGSIRLYCTGHFQKTISGFRLCLVSFPFNMEMIHLLPLEIRDEYRSVSMSLLRGASSA